MTLIRRKKLTVNARDILHAAECFFCLYPFLEPAYFQENEGLRTFMQIWTDAAIVVTILLFLLRQLTKRQRTGLPFAIVMLLVGFHAWILLRTFGLGHPIKGQMFLTACCFAVCIQFYYMATDPGKGYLWCGVVCYEVLCYVNLVLQIMFPEGMFNFEDYNIYGFIGHKNAVLRILFPGILLSVTYAFRTKGRMTLRVWCYMSALLATILLLPSSTSLVAYILTFSVILLFHRGKLIGKWVTLNRLFAISVAGFFMVAVFQYLEVFSDFIRNVLKKDLTLTGRTAIWGLALIQIGKHPLLGYGYEASIIRKQKFLAGLVGFDSCHNFYLDITYQGGLVGMAILAAFIILIGKRLENGDLDPGYKAIITFAFIIYFVSWNFEPFIDGSIYNVFATLLFAGFVNVPAVGQPDDWSLVHSEDGQVTELCR